MHLSEHLYSKLNRLWMHQEFAEEIYNQYESSNHRADNQNFSLF